MRRTKITVYISCCLIFILLPCTVCAEIDISKKADTAKKCSICHYRWINTFYVEHRRTPLAPLQEEKVVGNQQMCLSCHDGSVRDSRDRICNDPGHRVGAIPSAHVHIPDKFPLDKNGALLCVTCHTPHATKSAEGTMVEFFLRAPNINSSFCKQCHATKTGGNKKGNHPTDILPKRNPAALIKLGGRLGTDPKNHIICETCHIPHGGVNNQFLVLSVEDPKTRSVLCEACHTKKPGLDSNPSLNRFSHPLDLTPGLAVNIPVKWESGQKVVLGTGGELVCRTCHIPHGAVDKKALLAEHNRKDSMCIQCHKEKKEIKSTSHYQKVLNQSEKNIKGRQVSDQGPCSPCHLVHQGLGELMWARETKNNVKRPGEVCINCHSTGGSAEKVMPGDFSHPMDIELSKGRTSLSLPLFDDNGKDKDGKIRCSTCHDFHNPSPSYNDPLKEEVKHSKFLRLSEEEASGICINCHPGHGLIKGTDHDLSITSPDYLNTFGLTVMQAGVCSPCHMAHHKRQQKYLWSAPLGPAVLKGWEQTYTANDNIMIMLCTGCHSPGKIAENEIPRFALHPREKMVEGMSGINLELAKNQFPIFTDAGEIAESGHIVCSTCHNPHQWDPHKEAEGTGMEIEGDVTNSFLRPNLNSKFCTGCHGEDILIKFTYYHSHLGRLKQETPFSFK